MPNPISGQSPERTITLPDDAGLVLFDLLGRLIEDEKGRRLVDLGLHDAEIWALNSFYCLLERSEVNSFKPNYASLLDAARSNILTENGGPWPRHRDE